MSSLDILGRSKRYLYTQIIPEVSIGRIIECYQELQINKVLISAVAVKNKFLGIDEQEYSLIRLVDYHNSEMKNILEWGTLKNYFTTKKYLQLYLRQRLKTSDIYLSQLRYKFLVGFEKFLREYQPLDHHKPRDQNTIMKHIERFRKMINMAIKNEWLEKDPFVKFKPTFIKKITRILN